MSNEGSSWMDRWGIKLTLVYLIALIGGIPLLAYFGAVKVEPLELNEVGDFLAGAFGPLAIFWVVLGFFQQGQELRNSVETLELQAKELANSVEQQKAMVDVTERQLNLDIDARNEQNRLLVARELPFFQVRPSGNSSDGNGYMKSRFIALNIGADASSVELTVESDEVRHSPQKLLHSAKNTEIPVIIHVRPNADFNATDKSKLLIVSENIRGQQRRQIFAIGNFAPKMISCEPPQY